MKNSRGQYPAIALAALLAFTACQQTQKDQSATRNHGTLNIPEVKRDMASFDKVYIPALSFTNMEKINESKTAMSLLVDRWRQFKNKYYHANPDDPQWDGDLDSIDSLITNAEKVVQSETHILDAHQKYLEHVRIVFMKLRKRNNIEGYLIDFLTRFHQPMEDIGLAAKGRTPQTWTADNLARIKHTLPEAMVRFDEIKNAELDRDLFGFDAAKTARIQKLIAEEEAALRALKQAIEQNNAQKIIETAIGIKPNFARLFKQFGDFKS